MSNIITFQIEAEAAASADYRKVLWTGEHVQLVVMTIPVGGEIGAETHPENDQILVIVSGNGEAVVSGETRKLGPGTLVVVPAGRHHNVVNTGPTPLVLHTVYGPPEHADGAVHATKEEADRLEEEGRDEPPQA